jgi:succinate dehydrogenase / fumarate reductase, iron-sulfur subunit
MKVTLKVWRQPGPNQPGSFQTYATPDLNPNMSFLEMLDVVNDDLASRNEEPIAFAHDCREGICGTCALTINGIPHGPGKGIATCQLYMRSFNHGDTITIEPFRARSFPLVRDLVVDRSALDRILEVGGFITVRTGSPPDGNAIPIPKPNAESAMDAAACIQCGACVAACKNASAMLFVAAKVSHLGLLPQGQPERYQRVVRMVSQMDKEGFGGCTVTGSCEAVCPKNISLNFISRMNRDYVVALFKGLDETSGGGAS